MITLSLHVRCVCKNIEMAIHAELFADFEALSHDTMYTILKRLIRIPLKLNLIMQTIPL